MATSAASADQDQQKAQQQQQQQQQQIRLDSLPIEQLQRLRKQLDEEVVILRSNIGALTTALERFSASLESVKGLQEGDSELMIPVSSSMYVRGQTKTNGKVMIDLGTGFFAKVPNEEGQAILTRKIEYVAKNRKAFQEDLKQKMLLSEKIVGLIQQKIQQQTRQ